MATPANPPPEKPEKPEKPDQFQIQIDRAHFTVTKSEMTGDR